MRSSQSSQPAYESRSSAGRQICWLLLVVALGLALHLPSLCIGFVGDDYIHQFILEGAWEHPSLHPWSLYDFGTRPRHVQSVWWENGVLPWWTQPDWKLRFFRPLTSVTIWLDHLLFHTWAPGYKLTTLLGYTGLLLLLYPLYRAFNLSSRTALLAILLFASVDCSLMPVGWVANRNSLLVVLCMVASLLVLCRYRQWGAAPALALALLLAVLACTAKESGIAAFALIVVYLHTWRGASGNRAARGWVWAGTIACVIGAFAYLAYLAAAGYGAKSLHYLSPWENPGEMLQRVCALLPAGICQLLGPVSMRQVLSHSYVSVPLVLLFGWVLWRELRGVAAAGFFAAWMIVTLLPQAAGKPSERLLFGAAVGSSALLAMFVTTILTRQASGTRLWGYRLLAVAVLAYAGALSAWNLSDGWRDYARTASARRQVLVTADVGPRVLGRREVFMLQSPHTALALAPITAWNIETGDTDVRFWPLQMGRRGLRWTRLDECSFELESLDDAFLTRGLEELFLTNRGDLVAGATCKTALFTVEMAHDDAGGLRRFRVQCPESLDTPRYRFVTFREGRFVATRPPPVGESVELPRLSR